MSPRVLAVMSPRVLATLLLMACVALVVQAYELGLRTGRNCGPQKIADASVPASLRGR